MLHKPPASKCVHSYTADYLKGIAILFVLITHLDWSHAERLSLLFPFWVDMAVPIFMFVTGYVSTMAVIQKDAFSLSEQYSLPHLAHKAWRILFPFAPIFLLEIMWCALKHEPIDSLFSAFVRGGFGPGSYYVSAMLQIALIFPLIFTLIKHNNTMGLLACIIVNALWEILQVPLFIQEPTYRLIALRHISCIAFGCFAFLNRNRHFKVRTGMILLLVGALSQLAISYFNIHLSPFPEWERVSLLPSLMVVPMLTWLIRRDPHPKLLRPFEILGKKSFEIFLVQMAFFWRFSDNIYALLSSKSLAFIACMAICIIAGVIYAYMLKQLKAQLRKVITPNNPLHDIANKLDNIIFKN